MKAKYSLIALPIILGLTACGGGNGSNNDPAPGGSSPTPDPAPDTYTFDSPFVSGESSVSYTGQTKRLLLISELTSAIKNLDDNQAQNVKADLDFFFDFNGSTSDGLNYSFELSGQTLVPGPTYGDVASGKSLSAKIAGNDPALIDGDFFGWEEGMDVDPTPEELVDYFFDQLHALATDGASDQITLADSSTVAIDVNYLSPEGLDYAQLVQKFLLGSVTFSQGTGDYLQTDFSVNNDVAASGKTYSFPQHKWDEAFGYFGAARDYNDYTDDEIAGKGTGTSQRPKGYFDTNGDGDIDLHSELNQANSTNCAKRDRGATIATNFTKDAFDAFVLGRHILNKDENLTADELESLREAALTASVTWEKCIAATVVHYINDTIKDMDAYVANGGYADLQAFKNLAKHWGEMKGFALGLQFNPDSPFRDSTENLDKLKLALSLMGDAPVLADGTQNGAPFNGGGANGVAQYKEDLLEVRDIFQEVYEFDADNVTDW